MSIPGIDKYRVMIVDETQFCYILLKQTLELQRCEVYSVCSGSAALKTAEAALPDLVLLDLNITDMDGYNVCRKLKQHPALQDLPVIFLSASDETDDKVRAFNAGGVDYITKPFHLKEVEARVGTHLKLRTLQHKLNWQRMVEEKVREISNAQQATIFALAKLAEQRDEDTGAHLERVREYCRILAEELGKDPAYGHYITHDFVECIQHASPLHDIGKIAIPDCILLKQGKLTSHEFELMKAHTVIGGENMQNVYNHYAGNVFIGMGIEIALYHHERWDGSGYPDGLVGKNIPLSARIMALADFYDALRSDRCYRKGMGHEEVRQMILNGDGTHFDPGVVRAFLAVEEQFKHIMESL